MTDKIGAYKAKQFSYAHEAKENNPSDYKSMDLHNNALGRRIAIENKGVSYDVLADNVYEAIQRGEAVIVINERNNK